MQGPDYNACSDLLDRNVEAGRGDKIAFIDPSRSLTYAQLQADTCRFARVLKALGVRREERIALAMLDTVDLPVAFLGAIRAGIVPVPLNTMLSTEPYRYLLEDSRTRVLVVSGALLSVIEPALAALPDLTHVMIVDGKADAPHIDFAVALAAEPPEYATAKTYADEPAFWLYSSGSTGAPKGAKHVHASLMRTAELYAQPVLGVREEHDREVGDDEIGELYVRGPTAADGYWNQREKSRRTFLGEWTRTGDKYIRHQGRFIYCGRADDMFKVSGIWVSPFEVEAALATHPAILEAAVVPAEDEDGLLKPKAFVVLKDGAADERLDESLKEHVKKLIGMWKYPRWIVVTDALPKTATGKIQRFKLREAA